MTPDNPYQPPPEPLPVELTEYQRSLLSETSAVPDPDFWPPAMVSVGILIMATALTQGLLAPLVFPLLAGIMRVCMVYSARARNGLPPLPAIRLLITSTMLCFWMQTAAVIIAGGLLWNISIALGWPVATWIMCSLAGAIVLSMASLIISVQWAKNV